MHVRESDAGNYIHVCAEPKIETKGSCAIMTLLFWSHTRTLPCYLFFPVQLILAGHKYGYEIASWPYAYLSNVPYSKMHHSGLRVQRHSLCGPHSNEYKLVLILRTSFDVLTYNVRWRSRHRLQALCYFVCIQNLNHSLLSYSISL